MNVRNGRTIKVTDDVLRTLAILKIYLGMRSYSDVIRFLIQKYYESVKVEV